MEESFALWRFHLVEQAKELWYRWIPGWLPLFLAILWVGMQYQRMNDRLDALEKQMVALQENQRQHQEKSGYNLVPQKYDEKQDYAGPRAPY